MKMSNIKGLKVLQEEIMEAKKRVQVDIKKKCAFTLAELLIALGVVGILVAILMPIVNHLVPDQRASMAKRAYYMVQTTVSELINDPACYPDKTDSQGAERRVGFDDGYGYENCPWGNNEIPDTAQYIETEGNASSKFATLFADKVGANDDSSIIDGTTDSKYFTSKEGIQWNPRNHSYCLDDHKNLPGCAVLMLVDVNGPDKGDNCCQSQHNIAWPKCAEDQTPDTFTIIINQDGGVTIHPDDTWAIEAVKVTN